MSSLEGLERLKNWQRTATPLVLSSVHLKGKMDFFECAVTVTFVDDSRLVLSNMDSPNEAERLNLNGVDFSCTQPSDLVLTFPDGGQSVLYEKPTTED